MNTGEENSLNAGAPGAPSSETPAVAASSVEATAHQTSVSPPAPLAVEHVAPDHSADASAGHVVAPPPLAVADVTAPPAPVATATVDASPVTEAAEPKRRVQLNPTIDPALAKPIPRYASGGTSAAAEPAEGAAVGDASSQMTAEIERAHLVGPGSEPATIPPQQDLDAGLEAEIAAAMTGSLTAPAATTEGSPRNTLTETPASEDQLQSGAKLKAKVQHVNEEDVLCEVGYRCPGVVPLRQFPQGKKPSVGEEFLVVVDKFDAEAGVIHVSLPKATRKIKGGWEELQVGQVVECLVNKTNKGGLDVTIGGLRAFLPASHVDLGFASSLDPYVGQKLKVQITEVNPAKRNLIVSRKAVLIGERKEASANFWPKAEVGQQYSGHVKTIKDYGAFIDIGGVDGFLHIGEISWSRVRHPSELLQEGQTVEVVILSLDREKQKISLGMRQLSQNPWVTIHERYSVGKNVTGKVTRNTDFGAFIELEQGVEGLVHISELDHKRVRKVSDVLNIGQDVTVQVLEVDVERQRISLSVKALKERPPEEAKPEVPAAPAYERKRKEPLRGGKGPGSGGGLFGNPNDFNT